MLEMESAGTISPGIGRREPLTHTGAVLSGCSTCGSGVEMRSFHPTGQPAVRLTPPKA